MHFSEQIGTPQDPHLPEQKIFENHATFASRIKKYRVRWKFCYGRNKNRIFFSEFVSFGLFVSSVDKNRVVLMIRVSFRHSKLAHCDIDEKFYLTPSQYFESARFQKNGYNSATV